MNQPQDHMEGAPLIRPSTTDHPLYGNVVDACRTVFDPEIPVNVFDLGLVYTDSTRLPCGRRNARMGPRRG
jgi:hypothetical protein